MPAVLMLITVLFPIICGLAVFFFPPAKERMRNIYTTVIAVIVLTLVIICVVKLKDTEIVLFSLIGDYRIGFKLDKLGSIFAIMVSVLWPFSLLYGYEYMDDEERRNDFFAFYTMSLGSVLGIAMAKDLLTMYVFYEMLTLLTFPLVMHTMTKKAVKAGITYLCYSLGGAAFALGGIVIIMNYGGTLDFNLGGIFEASMNGNTMLVFAYALAFCGFSVKAAMMPFGMWLVSAAVAPTPVTALLHAVAVVKAGVFACMRLTYFIFGTECVNGSWAHYLALILSIATIIWGSSMAVKEQHLKRRLAYSTISNLSYILFGVALMTPDGLNASLAHMIAHAVAKIGLFFTVGAIMKYTHKEYVYEMYGIARSMKKMFAAFTLSCCSLTGIPLFIGFISKYKLITAGISSDSVFGYVGAYAIIASALLTAIYLFGFLIKAYFPAEGKVSADIAAAKDPGWKMLLPIVLSSVVTLVFGIYWEPLLEVLNVW